MIICTYRTWFWTAAFYMEENTFRTTGFLLLPRFSTKFVWYQLFLCVVLTYYLGTHVGTKILTKVRRNGPQPRRGKKQKTLLIKLSLIWEILSENTWKRFMFLSRSKFLLSKIESFSIPYFYITWKFLKKPMVGRPIVAGYNWILTPASIFCRHFLERFL